MRKFTAIVLVKILIVFFINRAITSHLLKIYTSSKYITTPEVVDLATEKFYYTLVVNVLFTIFLFEGLKKTTTVTRTLIFVISIATFILNAIIPFFHLI